MHSILLISTMTTSEVILVDEGVRSFLIFIAEKSFLLLCASSLMTISSVASLWLSLNAQVFIKCQHGFLHFYIFHRNGSSQCNAINTFCTR
jgi:hypothetical protein